jgi:hypothetical protein
MGRAGDARVVIANRLLALPGQVLIVEIQSALRTVSVAVRVPGRESSRRHGHIADSAAAVGLI